MEDHVHLLVETESEVADLQRFVKLMKQRSGFRFSKRFGQRLWQGSYFDRTLRSDEATEDAMRYILDNPVRARLVKSPLEYPFMGSDYGPLEEILIDLGHRR